MLLNAKGQVTIPADLRAKHHLREGDEVDVVEVSGVLTIVRREGTESRGWRAVRRLQGSATDPDTAGMTTDELMELLRGE